MGFMNSYKRLDNLCKDMNGKGISGYIEDMERNPNGNYFIADWKNDYKTLKHYRYIRNQIAHDNYAEEANLCSEEDTVWIENFYQRILNQNDPLTLYKDVAKPKTVNKKPEHSEIYKMSETLAHTSNCSSDYSSIDILKHFLPILITLAIVAIVLIIVIGFFL